MVRQETVQADLEGFWPHWNEVSTAIHCWETNYLRFSEISDLS